MVDIGVVLSVRQAVFLKHKRTGAVAEQEFIPK